LARPRDASGRGGRSHPLRRISGGDTGD
jgi:hypothetical protein